MNLILEIILNLNTKYIFADLGMRLWKNNKQVITLSNSCFDVSTLDYESFFQEDYNADILSYKERNGGYLGYSTSVRKDILELDAESWRNKIQ